MESVARSGATSQSRPGKLATPEVRWAIGVGLATAVIWEIVARVFPIMEFLLPPLSRVLVVGWQISLSGYLWGELWHTLVRVGLGLGWGFVAGVVLGVAMALVPLLRWIFDPIVAAVYPMPKIALLPLFLVAFGLGDTSRVILIGITCFFIVVISTAGGLRSLDPIYHDALTNLGAGRAMIARRLMLPGALPGILTGFRLAAGIALLITLAVEFTAARDGLGWMMWMAWQTLALERLYVGLIVCGLLGIGMSAGVRFLERWLLPWKNNNH